MSAESISSQPDRPLDFGETEVNYPRKKFCRVAVGGSGLHLP